MFPPLATTGIEPVHRAREGRTSSMARSGGIGPSRRTPRFDSHEFCPALRPRPEAVPIRCERKTRLPSDKVRRCPRKRDCPSVYPTSYESAIKIGDGLRILLYLQSSARLSIEERARTKPMPRAVRAILTAFSRFLGTFAAARAHLVREISRSRRSRKRRSLSLPTSSSARR